MIVSNTKVITVHIWKHDLRKKQIGFEHLILEPLKTVNSEERKTSPFIISLINHLVNKLMISQYGSFDTYIAL